jgi:hypothetical protein
MKKIIGFALLTLNLCFSCFAATQKVSLEVLGQSEVFRFAKDELTTFLGKNYEISTTSDTPWQISMQEDSSLAKTCFRIEYKRSKSGQHRIVLSGHNASDAMCAMYTFLEKAGMRFEITGPLFAENIDLNRLKNYSETISPKVKQRGIRQHINFTMDVSSYPIQEAKEYIRNLARLRFNYIAFHSYPGQWYGDPFNKKEPLAGNFFYGKQHDIPDEKLYKEKIRNKKTFCIPEIEPYFDDKPKREEMAINWLREVMNESKRVGLTVRLSFEPRGKDGDLQSTIAVVKKLLSNYSIINELELITSETAEVGNQLKEPEIAGLLTPLFGSEVLKDPIVMKPILSGSSDIANLFAQIGHNIKVLEAIDKDLLKPKGIKGSLGLYVAFPDYLEASFHLLRKYAPEASYAVLPGHGSIRVARFLPNASMKNEDWQKTMIYSWLEFDGIMYLQQNGIRGIRSLIEEGEDINGLEPIGAICFNHWRTAENKVTARYASEATIFGSIDETTFYVGYAQVYGIDKPEVFAKAMKQIDLANWYATNDLPNVGFSYALGSNAVGFGFLRKMKPANLKQGRELYEKSLQLIQSCLSTVKQKEGKELLTLLDNRLRATVIYLKAFEKGVEIQQFDEKKLTDEHRKKIATIINETISGFEQYIKLYSENMPDRGCEGTIISAYYVRIDALKKIRNTICGIPYLQNPQIEKVFDAPPPPINKY